MTMKHVSPTKPMIAPVVPLVEDVNEKDDRAEEGKDDTEDEVLAAISDDGDEVLCGPCEPENDDEEAPFIRKLKNPYRPSRQEMEDHIILHWPFQSWCRACVFGRGKHTRHLKKNGHKEKSNVPSISLDFIFLGSRDVIARKNAILVMYDNESDAVWAYRTGRKRSPSWLIPAMIQDLNEAGYSKSRQCLRSDQERVIKAIKTDLIRAREADSVPMESPAKESQCNGRMERMIQTLEGQIRTLQMDLKLNSGITVKPDDVAYQYLVNWACTIITRYRLTACGKTPFQILTGRKCERPLTGFATPVLWKQSLNNSEKQKGETDWGSGVFLGVRWRTSEAIIATDGQMIRCRTMQKDPDNAQVTEEMLKAIPESAITCIYGGSGMTRLSTGHIEDSDKDYTESESDNNNDDDKSKSLDEDQVADLFGDVDDAETTPNIPAEPNTPEDNAPSRQWRRLRRPAEYREAENDTDWNPGMMNSLSVELPQAQVQSDLWHESLKGTMSRRAESNKILGQLMKGVDVTEVYSPPRFAAACLESGLLGGTSFDLRTGWDLSNPKQQRMAVQTITSEAPRLVIASPPCTLFSNLQNLNLAVQSEQWKHDFFERRRKAEAHLACCCKLYKLQRSLGRYYLHEHPSHASSWKVECMRSMEQDIGAIRVRADQCRFGLVTKKNGIIGPAKKPTDFLANAAMIAKELSRRCTPGQHVHIALDEGRAKAAERYPPGLVRAIITGLKNQIKEDGKSLIDTRPVSSLQLRKVLTEFGSPPHWVDNQHSDGVDEEITKMELNALRVKNGEAWAVNDVSGSALDPTSVKAARALELEYFHIMKVYTKVPRSVARGKKIIKTRWIDINKGDEANPNMRSRLVGKEFADGIDPSLYAYTPPIEAMRMILSRAATVKGDGTRRIIMTNDVSRAYFHATVQREVYVEIPVEDKHPSDGDVVGRLNLCLYGTRDAAHRWQETVAEHLESLGFKRGKAHPAVFYHQSRDIATLVHGDDYMSAGTIADMKWLKQALTDRFEIKTQMIGHEQDCDREGKILNRVIRATDHVTAMNLRRIHDMAS